MDAYAIYEGIIRGTNSELILFFVILSVLLVMILPVLRKGRRDKAEDEAQRHARYLEREQQIINVIRENSQVIAQLSGKMDKILMLLKEPR